MGHRRDHVDRRLRQRVARGAALARSNWASTSSTPRWCTAMGTARNWSAGWSTKRRERSISQPRFRRRTGSGPRRRASGSKRHFRATTSCVARKRACRISASSASTCCSFTSGIRSGLDRDEWRRAFEDLKTQGKVRAFGISINNHQPDSALGIIETGLIDAVQVIYNIFDQSPERNLFPACIKHNIGVLARVPLDEGALDRAYHRRHRFPGRRFPQSSISAATERSRWPSAWPRWFATWSWKT